MTIANPMEQFELAIKLERIFMPVARRRRDALYLGGQRSYARFVHYTSAEAALSIIKSKRIWMRNTRCMSDYREVQHGYDMLLRFFSESSSRVSFFETFSSISPGAAEEALALFDQWGTNIRFSTYIASISEHDDKEDLHGRLSMWRAFGNSPARVAIVLRVPWFTPAQDPLNVMFSPVAYLQETEARSVIDEVLKNSIREKDFLKTIDRTQLIAMIFNMLVGAVVCLKHEGFHEEREWRVVYSPERTPSPLIETSTETIGGIPQIVYKMPLDKAKFHDLEGLDLTNTFDRIIIGPSQFGAEIAEALATALRDIEVSDARDRIFISGIPIRS